MQATQAMSGTTTTARSRDARRDAMLVDATAYVLGGALASSAEALVAPPRQPRSPLSPPGPVIGLVWSGLFAAFGAARGRLTGHRGARGARQWIDALWLLCVAYPLLTGGQRNRGATYAANAVIAGVAAQAVAKAGRFDAPAGRLLLPVLPWVAYATLLLLTDRRR